MQYAILGKLTAKPKIDGKRVKVRKKAHMLHRGRTLCRAENGYKKRPRYTEVENPETWQICRICLGMDGHGIRCERKRHDVVTVCPTNRGQRCPKLATPSAPTPSNASRPTRMNTPSRCCPCCWANARLER